MRHINNAFAGFGLALAIGLCLQASEARAFCYSEDSCPISTGAGLTGWRVCALSGTGPANCDDPMTFDNNDIIYLGTDPNRSDRLYACVYNGSSYEYHRLGDVDTDAFVTAALQPEDVVICFGSANNTVIVLTGGASCGAESIDAWDYGSSYQLQLRGQGGVDVMDGGLGSDQLCGGSGGVVWSEDLDGRYDADDVDGGSGSDLCQGGSGNDEVYGYDGADKVVDASGSTDVLYGEGENDSCIKDCDATWTTFDCGPGTDTAGNNTGTRLNCEGYVSGCYSC